MRLKLVAYSFRQGESHLNMRPAIRHEIEAILLQPLVPINRLTREQYVEFLREEFKSKGWQEPPPVVDRRRKLIPLPDFHKDRVGLELGLQSRSSVNDIGKFQSAHNAPMTRINVGVYVLATTRFQRELSRQTGTHWAGPSFQQAEKGFISLARMISVPVCVFGLEVDTVAGDGLGWLELASSSPAQLRRHVFRYLEMRHGLTIDPDIRLNGPKSILEFDGIIRLHDQDIILAVVPSGTRESLFEHVPILAQRVREYQLTTGRESSLRCILVGSFSKMHLQEFSRLIARQSLGYNSVGIEMELYSYDELQVR